MYLACTSHVPRMYLACAWLAPRMYLACIWLWAALLRFSAFCFLLSAFACWWLWVALPGIPRSAFRIPHSGLPATPNRAGTVRAPRVGERRSLSSCYRPAHHALLLVIARGLVNLKRSCKMPLFYLRCLARNKSSPSAAKRPVSHYCLPAFPPGSRSCHPETGRALSVLPGRRA